MISFICLVAVVMVIFVFDLRSRVQKLEEILKTNGTTPVSDSSNQRERQKRGMEHTDKKIVALHDYVKQQLGQGMQREKIKDLLMTKGWGIDDIEKAFKIVDPLNRSLEPVTESIDTTSLSSDKFFTWFKEDWLLKIGALLMLIGFGWLTTYAFLNNWIGPMGRIVLGIVGGVVFVLLGHWRIKKYIHQGGIFLVLGSTTILLTLFAAREIYDFFTPISVLIAMFLSSGFVAFTSVKYKSRILALTSLIFAGIAPLLTNTPSPDYPSLFAYLFVVIIGVIWIVVLIGSRELTLAALLLVTFYSLPHLLSVTSADKGILLLFAYAFATVFFITNTAGILRLKNKEIIPDLITAAGNGLLLLAWIMLGAEDEWKSVVIAAWMVVFAIGGFLIFKATHRREPFYVYAWVGIAMLAAATSVELDGATLAIAYIIESGVIAMVTYSILKDTRIAERMSLLMIGPVIFSLKSVVSPAWDTGIFHKDFFVLFILALTLLGLGLFFLPRIRKLKDKEAGQINALLLNAGGFYGYLLLWLSSHAMFKSDNMAVMVPLIVYTVIGLIFYFYGRAHQRKGLWLHGGLVIGFVIGRLFLVDIWKMELAGKITTFFIIGALLVSTAFIGNKGKKSHMIQ